MGEEGRALKELAMGTSLVRAAIGDLHRIRCGEVWEGVGIVFGGLGMVQAKRKQQRKQLEAMIQKNNSEHVIKLLRNRDLCAKSKVAGVKRLPRQKPFYHSRSVFIFKSLFRADKYGQASDHICCK